MRQRLHAESSEAEVLQILSAHEAMSAVNGLPKKHRHDAVGRFGRREYREALRHDRELPQDGLEDSRYRYTLQRNPARKTYPEEAESSIMPRNGVKSPKVASCGCCKFNVQTLAFFKTTY